MKLEYHNGKNFGDSLNPILFKKLLPDFFDEDTRTIFLGIGTIIGLKKGYNDTKKIIVFSSGATNQHIHTYGTIPKIDSKYDIYCVRGPMTAKLLNLDNDLAITDGALLTRFVYKPRISKKYKCSYMPHVGSYYFYPYWKNLLEQVGINVIDPRIEPLKIVDQIVSSELLIAEAMHGAIIADAYRVPWIPVRCYETINEFKWIDFSLSVGLKYEPIELPSIFSSSFLNSYLKNKFHIKISPFKSNDPFIFKKRRDKFLNKIIFIKKQGPRCLSSLDIQDEKMSRLLDTLLLIKKKYTD